MATGKPLQFYLPKQFQLDKIQYIWCIYYICTKCYILYLLKSITRWNCIKHGLYKKRVQSLIDLPGRTERNRNDHNRPLQLIDQPRLQPAASTGSAETLPAARGHTATEIEEVTAAPAQSLSPGDGQNTPQGTRSPGGGCGWSLGHRLCSRPSPPLIV